MRHGESVEISQPGVSSLNFSEGQYLFVLSRMHGKEGDICVSAAEMTLCSFFS